jgi:hypothetical protein
MFPGTQPQSYAFRSVTQPLSSGALAQRITLGSVTTTWEPETPGLLRLSSGRLVRGRGLRRALPAGATPDFGVYLLGRRPPRTQWEARWVRWRNFGLPADPGDAALTLREAWERAEHERVEIACAGGLGRTGTALACLAVLEGLPADEAVAYVRGHYAPRAVEMPRQHRFVTQFPSLLS